MTEKEDKKKSRDNLTDEELLDSIFVNVDEYVKKCIEEGKPFTIIEPGGLHEQIEYHWPEDQIERVVLGDKRPNKKE